MVIQSMKEQLETMRQNNQATVASNRTRILFEYMLNQKDPAEFLDKDLLRKLKEVFRQHRSHHVRQVIDEINPILRGWVSYFRIGNSSEMLCIYQRLGRKEAEKTSYVCPKASRIWMEEME